MKLFVPSVASQNSGMKEFFFTTRLLFSIFIQASRKITYQPRTAQLPDVRINLNQQQNFTSTLSILLFGKLFTAM